MNVFIGLDVSLASTAICVLGPQGKIVEEVQAESEPEALVRAIGALPYSIDAIGLEAGPLSQWLSKGMEEAGFDVVMMETRLVKAALKAMPIKTDRRDAQGIARLLQLGWYRPVHRKSVSSQEIRALLTARKSVQQAIINLELSMRGVLRNFGLKLGHVTRIRYEARVRELVEQNEILSASTEALLRARAQLRAELAELDAKIASLAKHDDVCRLMMTMPGVGPIVALTVKSAIDDPTRFARSKDVGPWAGLTPRRTQSGEMDIVGQITRVSDRALRAALYQAAMILMHRGSPNWLQAWALRVAHRRGSKRALIALARRIGVVLHRMWRDGTPFRYAPSPTATV
ncbi:IS110 family transposase (plasmid) [Pseudosulfitobacter pseudonitzschiae]|uniref:IS110 family transposase n=1 Tax=Pseudosulfitobacter pseudonitzschiae TaxID=1402135 RepID=UPI001E5F68AA|nr:IS110 family transposase [Pseudosulfitobacter pseudonitzschiae]UFE83210.1 IS110 family transposase [Pseudosulfitobacter pseudonitzschiae]UFG04176.1 IS110 family transposase [Pseudosulfitobacter pseudonitzschiae]